ncbi:MAG: biopolymer transporter ExbD [Planctomycetes bacterium]|nr:biopolymer transporter ExbD [Planctomycetota bacterium]
MSPLIDCVFLLLIFFLVSTMMKKINKDIDINLPESRSAEKMLPTNDQIVIGIDREGTYFLEGKEEDLMTIHSELRELSVTNPEFQVRIDTDRDAPLCRVVEVVDLCQFDGLSDIVLRTYDEHYNAR